MVALTADGEANKGICREMGWPDWATELTTQQASCLTPATSYAHEGSVQWPHLLLTDYSHDSNLLYCYTVHTQQQV